MTILYNTVKQALKDKSPALFKTLSEKGELSSYLDNLVDEIKSQTNSRAVTIANRQGYQKEPDLIKRAGLLNSAHEAAQEIVLSDMLEFPQGGTSPQNQD